MSLIEEYRKTLEALFSLLGKKQALRREMRSDVVALSDLDKHIGLIQQEIDETQEVLYLLERRKQNDGSIHYGYRKRGFSGVHGCIAGMSNFSEITSQSSEGESNDR